VFGFFVPNIKHKGTSGITHENFFMSLRLLNTTETPQKQNTTVVSKTKNLYIPKTPEHHGTPRKGQDRWLFELKHHGKYGCWF
jgi:hypothetical protein